MKSLENYVEYYNEFRPHMGLNEFTPYEKLKELQGERISKAFEVYNILLLDKSFNFCINKNERICSHPI